MSLQFQSAFDDLRRTHDVYQKTNRNYDPLAALTELNGLAMKDKSFIVAPALDDVRLTYAGLAAILSQALSNSMIGFQKSIRTSSTSVGDLIILLLQYMDRNSLAVQSRNVTIEAPVNPAGNTGTQKLYVNTKTAKDWVDESCSIESFVFRRLQLAGNLRARGQDTYVIESSARQAESEFDGPGVGGPDGGLVTVAPGRSEFFNNASFDRSFNGTGTNKIPGITIISGDANIAHSILAADIAEDRGGTQGALLITGACEFTIDFVENNTNLSFKANGNPMMLGVRADVSAAANFTLKLHSANTAGADEYKETFAVAAPAGYVEYVVDPDTKNSWPSVFDVDNRPILNVKVNSVTGTLKLDDLILDVLEDVSGVRTAMVAGITSPAEADSHTHIRRHGALYGSVQITGGAGSILSVTVDGVELLTDAVAFDTDVNTSAIALMNEINETRTDPDYEAFIDSAALDTVRIYQRKPDPDIAGNVLTVATAGATLTNTTANLTANDVGTIQDTIVRAFGQALPHAASATSGLED